MDIIFGALAILSLTLAFQADPELFLGSICSIALDMLNGDDPRDETGAPDAVDMGELAADTLGDVIRFMTVVARLAIEDCKVYHGGLHILSLQAKLGFQVSSTPASPDEAQYLHSILGDLENIESVNIHEVVVGEDMELAYGPQKDTVRLSLKYVGPSSAAVFALA
ncbi:hypothetical protein M409DRAFT_18022 [Zasmidium cellare ATCC 36951]|uniref:Uncharacterized protein n=1 Tax=Zasmidium cellare ATCC 36951 TaxID=1080233 RepID=A0A6A6D118_ZASCE|nr:uncharacterized protein M409DRAFT_18022 [Zasmidium cellare ATCC 36951]KAF2171789.1 hypothetical protein M409DRAFT_18022 [Zasmidium cellare ATCC 36951]